MSGNIPDLQKSNISWIAYYDATDKTGLSELNNVSDINKSGGTVSTTPYNDGHKITYSTGTGRNCVVRISKQGWISAHFDRTEEYQGYSKLGPSNRPRGLHDIVNWSDNNSEQNLKQNELERAIRDCLGQLDQWSSNISGVYDPSDVNLHNYQYGPGNVSLFSETNKDDGNLSFVFTEATEIEKAVIATITRTSREPTNLTINGNSIFNGEADAVTVTDITGDITLGEEFVVNTGRMNYSNYAYGSSYTIDMSVNAVVIWK